MSADVTDRDLNGVQERLMRIDAGGSGLAGMAVSQVVGLSGPVGWLLNRLPALVVAWLTCCASRSSDLGGARAAASALARDRHGSTSQFLEGLAQRVDSIRLAFRDADSGTAGAEAPFCVLGLPLRNGERRGRHGGVGRMSARSDIIAFIPGAA